MKAKHNLLLLFLLFFLRDPAVQLSQLIDALAEISGKEIRLQTPLPVLPKRSGMIDPRLFPLNKIILHGNNAQICHRAVSLSDHVPDKCAVICIFGVYVSPGQIPVMVADLLDPGPCRRIIMRARIYNTVLDVVVRL